MKVLQLCNKPPQPLIDGGCIAINNIANGLLHENIDLKILTIATQKHPFIPEKIESEFAKKTKIESVFVDTRINVIDAFSALVTSDSYNISRFFSPDFNKRLKEILNEDAFDVVHLESLFMTPYIDTIRKNSSAKIVLRSHNLEHLIWERLANSTENTAKKFYLKHLASKLKKYEYDVIKELDGIAAISFDDTKKYKSLKEDCPLLTIPFGITLKNYPLPELEPNNELELFHIGAMDWEPNKEAVNWILDDIWPKLKKKKVNLNLAGRHMPGYIHQEATDRLIVHGEVDSAVEFMSKYDVMIAPLLSGSGMRVKIIEAMGLGKTVITTRVGAEGIDYQDGENIIIANTSGTIIHAINRLIENPQEIKRIGKNARHLIEKKYDNNLIINNLLNFYKEI
ncbi:glycosyltransferase family 4 protein [Crocinitomix algicola]|uniref:glycosyltransferase family 4 protein n=1 Tax=Crocinitomix algicola TaxID=1740263 RepID=UPI0008319594|nr:glycosyltransferase family 4 protein [Crocinitomix algicola]